MGAKGSRGSVSVSETAPLLPEQGDMWFDPSTLDTHTYYNDGDSAQWVALNRTGATGATGADGSITISETAPVNPDIGDMWFDPSVLQTFIYYSDGSSSQWVRLFTSG